MPGLAGFTCRGLAPEAARRSLEAMRALLAHGDARHADELFCDRSVCATRTHTNILQTAPQPHGEDGWHVWLDGEFYNREELARSPLVGDDARPKASSSDPALLLALFQNAEGFNRRRDGFDRSDDGSRQGRDDFDFLKNIDGIFSAVVYDARAGHVHLLSDRYGLRHLFWARHAGGLAWASEVKAMLALPGFEPKIERASVRDFFEAGNLTGERTWLEGVELLPAATVLTLELEGRAISARRYWSADEIKPLPESSDAVELAEELGRLFRASVERRFGAGGRAGLTLSGGLDSRAILAAVPERGAPLHAVTFGKRGCEDARVAALAAARKGATHHAWELDAAGWLAPRFGGVWWTDGAFDLMHMHVLTIVPRARELFDIVLDGLGANGVVGDSWMSLGMSGPREYLDTRTRRFLILGPAVVRGFVEERFPFLDHRFVELATAAPDALKANNALYRMMLLKTFPAFFESIPWQKTGAPINWPRPNEGRRKHLVELKDQLLYKLSWYGLTNPPARGYADYADWMRREPARTVFKEMLTSRSALYAEYVPRERVEDDLEKHFAGRDRAEFLGRALTFEIWLRQLFEGAYRSAPDVRGCLVEAK